MRFSFCCINAFFIAAVRSCLLRFTQTALEIPRLRKMEIFIPRQPEWSTFQFRLVRVWKVHFILRIISDSCPLRPTQPGRTCQWGSRQWKELRCCWPKSCTLSTGKTFALAFGKTLIPAIIRLAVASTDGGNFAIRGLCCLLALHLMSWRVLLNLRICAQTTFRWPGQGQGQTGRWVWKQLLRRTIALA